MKNKQKGFVAGLLIAVIALLMIGGGVYVYENKKVEAPSITDTDTQQADQIWRQANTQSTSTTIQSNSTNNKPINSATDNQKILNSLVTDWKRIGSDIIPGRDFYGYPYTIQFIGNHRIIISYENDFNPLFAVLNYDTASQKFSYLDGLRSSPFEVNESLWNTWMKKYGDISSVPQTYQFSSVRTGEGVYPSDWKFITKNPFISNKSPINSPPVSQSENKKIISCNSIVGSGNYTMDKDLNVTGNGCFSIANMDNVNINCGGHSIILDQQSKSFTEELNPLLGLKNIRKFSITSCNFKVVNPSFTPSTISIVNSSDGIISDNTFYDQNVKSDGLDVFSITLDNSYRIKFSGNTVYGVYQQHYSNNNIIEKNTFSPTLKTLKQIQVPVSSDNGNHNIISDNTIDGKWDGTDPALQVGADDGIEISDEFNDTIERNKIKNNWDCGIETTGLIQNFTISGNTILNSGICGIGAWYYNSWKGNMVADNIIDSSPKMFYFFRSYALRAGENAVYFTDNIFRGNSFLNPTQDVSAIFSFHANSGGEKVIIDNTPYVANNNQFTNNNFNSKLRAPLFNPTSMVIDGGGNICGNIAGGDYPNTSIFPLRCTSQ